MGEDRFQIGDKVRLVKWSPYMLRRLKEGDEGVVVSLGTAVVGASAGVDWGRNIGGHDCGGACPVGHGYFVNQKHIELATEISAPDVSEEEFCALLCGEVRYGGA